MPNKRGNVHFVGLWLSNKAYNEYVRLVKTSPNNPHETPGQMMKWVLEWYPFRHSTRKFKKGY